MTTKLKKSEQGATVSDLPKTGLALVSKPEDPLFFSFRMELRKLLDEPLTSRSLFQIEQTSALAKQLFAVRSAPDSLAKLRRNKVSGNVTLMPNPSYVGGDLGMGDSPADYGMADTLGVGGGGFPLPSAIATAPGIETFGAQAIREIMDGTKGKPKEESTEDLMRLLRQAKTMKEKDLELTIRGKLQKRLGSEALIDAEERERAKDSFGKKKRTGARATRTTKKKKG